MAQQTMTPQNAQPLGPQEFTPEASHDVAPPEPGPETTHAQTIRDAFHHLGVHASGPQVQEALAGQGVQVDLPEIYAIRNHLLHRAPAVAEGPAEPRQDTEAEQLLKVKQWAQEVGGPQRLKELCDLLLRLQDQ